MKTGFRRQSHHNKRIRFAPLLLVFAMIAGIATIAIPVAPVHAVTQQAAVDWVWAQHGKWFDADGNGR